MPYNPIRIQNFLADRVMNLQRFCFVLQFAVNPGYAYRFLAGDTSADKSRELVLKAQAHGQLGELVFQLVKYWLVDIRGNPRVLVQEGIHEELTIFRQELLDRGNQGKAKQVMALLEKIGLPSPPTDQLPPDGRFEHGYAVLIGVGEHLDQRINSLPATVKDPNKIQGVLLDPTWCAYLDEHVHLATGPAATRESILKALDWLAERASQDTEATAVFYFSGHGWKDQDADPPRYYLIPYDCDWDRIDETTVRDDLFTEKLNAIQAERLAVILDACHAGGVSKDASPLPKGFVKATPPTSQLSERLGSGSGRVVLSSCQEGELSYVCKDDSLSIFTACLIEALSGRAFDAQADKPAGKIGILDVFKYLGERVPARVKEERHRDPRTGKPAQQHPVLDAAKTSNFPIALLRGGKGKAGA
jgi:hypothetical protein